LEEPDEVAFGEVLDLDGFAPGRTAAVGARSARDVFDRRVVLEGLVNCQAGRVGSAVVVCPVMPREARIGAPIPASLALRGARRPSSGKEEDIGAPSSPMIERPWDEVRPEYELAR
jgi:hypothetical protein